MELTPKPPQKEDSNETESKGRLPMDKAKQELQSLEDKVDSLVANGKLEKLSAFLQQKKSTA